MNNSKVGIFWYDNGKIFGIGKVSAESIPFDVNGLRTSRIRHSDFWKSSPELSVLGDYQKFHRGRIFQSPDCFLLKAGNWVFKLSEEDRNSLIYQIETNFDLIYNFIDISIDSRYDGDHHG